MKAVLIGPLLALLAVSAAAIASPITYQLPDETADLKPGPGEDSAQVCRACHSADYISTQPSKKGKGLLGGRSAKDDQGLQGAHRGGRRGDDYRVSGDQLLQFLPEGS